ncbi:MAG: hypothetical protein R3F61_01945 [Myxococcota bacterium]
MSSERERLYATPEDERTPEEAAAVTAFEEAQFGASFDAWRLARQAEDAGPEDREALWDATMEAFARIASTPVDPGNDEGPFWAVASALDLHRVHQALAIVDRMAETPGWTYRLNGSRAALAGRLAALGRFDEALEQVARLDPEDGFFRHWRADAWGRVVGARRTWSPGAVESLLADVPDDVDLVGLMGAMIWVGGPVPTEAELAGWRGVVERAHPAKHAVLSSWLQDWVADPDEDEG